MPKGPLRRFPPRKEVDHKNELDISRPLREFHKGIDRVNRLLVVHAQDSDAYVAAMRRGRRINRWGRVSTVNS